MFRKYLHIHSEDNLVVALQDLPPGTVCEVAGCMVTLKDFIPAKHKFSLKGLNPGDLVSLYGVTVGEAVGDIPAGGVISTENIVHKTSSYRPSGQSPVWEAPDVSPWKGRTFLGYHRNDGSVGTANYWIVIPLVFCENRNLEVMDAALTEALGYERRIDYGMDVGKLVECYRNGATPEELLAIDLDTADNANPSNRIFPQVDGVKFLKHQGGCGGTRQDSQLLCRLLAGYITHPNVAGATVLSLGCQNAQIDDLQQAIHQRDPQFAKPVFYLQQQQSSSERAFIEEAIKKTFAGMAQANEINRKPAPISKLRLGLECGGSDGFSGISANPVLGYTSDLLVALGASAILSEFPELNGVEQELINRCQNEALAEKFSSLMQAYARSAEAVGSGFENNPSPGNIKDGLITDAIKSAGAAKKGGTSPICQVLDYGEAGITAGLNLLCTPGNDVESTTGLAGAGANLIVFTTGLGTPTGNPVVPVVKVSSNTQLFKKMGDIIDFNTGEVITGEATIEEKGKDLLEYLIEVASGRQIPAAVRLMQNDFIPWKRGVSL